jgi:tetratricopeptide (TPR) repeat protein
MAGGGARARRLGALAAALGALYAPFIFYDVQLLKESLAVDLAAALVWALAVARRRGTLGAWLAAGALGGLLALLRENFLVAAPFLLPLAGRRGEGVRRSLLRASAFVVGLALPLVPVAARNAALGGGFLPTTSQGGANFWIGNNPEADGTYRPLTPGRQIPRLEREEPRRLAESTLGRTLSAAEVSRFWRARSLAWAAAEPGRFARLQARKLALFWSGYEWPDAVDYYWMKTRSPALAAPLLEFGAVALGALAGALLLLRARALGAFAPALLFALGWMVSTVAFFLFARYRLPVVPALLALAAVPLDRIVGAFAERRWRAALLGAGVVALAWAAPHLAGYAPRAALVEYNLGRLFEEAGAAALARGHYEAALAADPAAFLPALNLGTLAARGGAYDAARTWFERAVAAEPRSPEAWSNLGGARLALGDFDGAAAAFARALELDPHYPPALGNRELLRQRRAASAGAHDPAASETD